jgi:4-amino-4-deoxy-L-arabinose transferase-like glycosyltransferase
MTGYRSGLLPVLMAAFAFRLVAAWICRNSPANPDAVEDYLPIARSILDCTGFLNAYGIPDHVRGPIYPLFIAAVQLFFGDELWKIRIAQALLDVLTTLLVVRLVRLTSYHRCAILAGAMYAVHPAVIYATAIVTPETLFAFLLTMSVLLVSTSLVSFNSDQLLLGGAFVGLTTLCRASSLLLTPVWILVIQALRHRRHLPPNRLLAVGFGLTILPWSVRNVATFHEFIPVVANGGSNFYAGSSREFFVPPPEHHERRQSRARQLIVEGFVKPEVEDGIGGRDGYSFRLGWANYRASWRDDPWELARLLLVKSARLFYATQSGTHSRSLAIINVTLLAAAAIGSRLYRRRDADYILVLLWIVTVGYFVMVFIAVYPLARYVIGFTPLLCALAAPVIQAVAGIGRQVTLSPPKETATQ